MFPDVLCLIVMESWIHYSGHKNIHLTSHTQSTPTERQHEGALEIKKLCLKRGIVLLLLDRSNYTDLPQRNVWKEEKALWKILNEKAKY